MRSRTGTSQAQIEAPQCARALELRTDDNADGLEDAFRVDSAMRAELELKYGEALSTTGRFSAAVKALWEDCTLTNEALAYALFRLGRESR